MLAFDRMGQQKSCSVAVLSSLLSANVCGTEVVGLLIVVSEW